MPEQYIRIKGGLVEEVVEEVVKQAKTDVWLRELQSRSSYRSPRLPKDCIFIFSSNGHDLYVIQHSPKMQTLKYQDRKVCATRMFDLTISLPWVQWWLCSNAGGKIVNAAFVTCTTAAVRTEKDPLFILPLTNLYDAGHGKLCTGNMNPPTSLKTSEWSRADFIEYFMERLYESVWNDDLLPSWPGFGLFDAEAAARVEVQVKEASVPFLDAITKIRGEGAANAAALYRRYVCEYERPKKREEQKARELISLTRGMPLWASRSQNNPHYGLELVKVKHMFDTVAGAVSKILGM